MNREEQQVPEENIDLNTPATIKQEEILLEWKSPSRPYKKHDREYYTTIAVIVVLLSVILFFAGQFLPIAVVVSAAFLSYVLAAVPPHNVAHSITTYGIRTLDRLFSWKDLGRFWFTEKYKQRMLNIEHTKSIPFKLILVIESKEQEKEIQHLLSQYLIHQTPLPTFIDKASNWLEKKIPLEKNE